MESGIEIDVDLVPVFSFKPKHLKFYDAIWENVKPNPDWLQGHSRDFQFEVNKALEKDFLIVPKPQGPNNHSWRLDFHDAEIQIIKSKGCAKPVIKLLKFFRYVLNSKDIKM